MPNNSQEPSQPNLNWLQRAFLKFGATRQGDVVIAQIGPGATNVAVGKNIIQIGSVKIPLWAIAVITLLVAVGTVTSGIGAVRSGQILTEFRATPTATAIPPMTGTFNVAVAKFDVVGEGEGVRMADRLAQEFTNSVESVFDELDDTVGEIEIRTPQAIGFLSGASAEERAIEARALAEAIGANVVIYGIVEVDGSSATLMPEFYVSESANAGLIDAWEITGQYQMGLPISLSDVNNQRERRKVADTLRDRFQALTHMIEGLAAFVSGDYADAQEQFEQALIFDAWNNKEVIYLLLGSTALKQKDYQDAESRYREALSVNRDYSRAYVGIASTMYARALSESANDLANLDTELVNAAISSYREAMNPELFHPPLADVTTKASFGLGQAYLLLALAHVKNGELEDVKNELMLSEQAFRKVIDDFGDGQNERLTEQAAHAHARIGIIFQLKKQIAEAIAQYEIAVDLLPDIDRTKVERVKYAAALGELYSSIQQVPKAIEWYERAIENAPADSKERELYQQRIMELR